MHRRGTAREANDVQDARQSGLPWLDAYVRPYSLVRPLFCCEDQEREIRKCPKLSAYYDQHATAFIATTRDVDMSDARGRFLAAVPARADDPARILDAGSGSGRDALAFRVLGYVVKAFDASPTMVAATQAHAMVPTRLMRFEDFAWDHPFEGIWACASLLHVAGVDLPGVLHRLVAHLVSGGALYLSFKRGTGGRVKDGRRFTDMTAESLAALLDGCGAFSDPNIWTSTDRRPDRASEVWVNCVVTKR
jgi:SAM-dependent methyltransferase